VAKLCSTLRSHGRGTGLHRCHRFSHPEALSPSFQYRQVSLPGLMLTISGIPYPVAGFLFEWPAMSNAQRTTVKWTKAQWRVSLVALTAMVAVAP
jgi:hypothetical protein